MNTNPDALLVQPFLVMELLKRANALEAAGRSIVHMEAGQPSTAAPAAVRAAARAALESERLGYVEALGLPALRARIADHYRDRHELTLDPRRIVVTTGSSAGFVVGLLSATARGGRVGMAAPYYAAQPNILRALGYQPVFIDTGPEQGLQLTAAALAAQASALDAVIIASPSNPSGAMIPDQELRDIVAVCAEHGIQLYSDEIYHGISYETPARSALEFGDQAIVINSFSKYFSMTGWRLGWMVVPEPLLGTMEALSQNLYISSPVLSQLAAGAAFDCYQELDAHVARYRRNRDLLMAALPALGLPLKAHPDGAFYLYTEMPQSQLTPLDWCIRLLEETGVACTPGTDFDRGERGRALRFSYAGSTEQIEDGIDRLRSYLA